MKKSSLYKKKFFYYHSKLLKIKLLGIPTWITFLNKQYSKINAIRMGGKTFKYFNAKADPLTQCNR